MDHRLQTGDSNLVVMRTSEVALQIYGCGHALETPIMYWKLLIEVHYRDIILRLADFPSSLLQFCHTQKTVCFGGVETHVRVMFVQIFFDCTEREKFLRDDTDMQAYLAELAVPELFDRACTLRLVRFSCSNYTKEYFFVVRRVFGNNQKSYLYFNNLIHLNFHLTATNGMSFDDGANAEWPAALNRPWCLVRGARARL